MSKIFFSPRFQGFGCFFLSRNISSALHKASPHVETAFTILELDRAWVGDLCSCDFFFVSYILERLAMCRSRVLGLRILNCINWVLQRWQFRPSLIKSVRYVSLVEFFWIGQRMGKGFPLTSFFIFLANPRVLSDVPQSRFWSRNPCPPTQTLLVLVTRSSPTNVCSTGR